jgi:gamma-glutamylcyclotransferase (GGCT)/AIG2-like uncharacterized protein YtfP
MIVPLEANAAAKTQSERLFSYGTLQLPQVQRATYGRLLKGEADVLPGFRLEALEITDEAVVRVSGEAVHRIARRTDDPADTVPGTVFSLTAEELAATDRYEVAAYVRTVVRLDSGASAWVYAAP